MKLQSNMLFKIKSTKQIAVKKLKTKF